jgi:pimeloyl-ACP methyl ester carboxylesterase
MREVEKCGGRAAHDGRRQRIAERYSGDKETDMDDVLAALLEAFKQESVGAVRDGEVLIADRVFDLGDVDRERKVWMVHGDQDVQAPVKIARWIDEKLGGGRLEVMEGKTHFSIWEECSEEIIRRSAEAVGA